MVVSKIWEAKEVSSTVTQIYCLESFQAAAKGQKTLSWEDGAGISGRLELLGFAGQILEKVAERVTEIYRGCLWSLELRTEQCSGTDWNVDGYMKNSFWKLQLNHQKMKTITSEMKNTLDEKSSWHITGGKGELTYHWTLSKMKNRIKITEKDNKQSVCELWDHVK